MTIKVGINGLGRIGRMIVRAITENKYKDIEIKHINNRSNSEVSSLLLKHDSIACVKLIFITPYIYSLIV